LDFGIIGKCVELPVAMVAWLSSAEQIG
jgi:hypothetical protein